ncbi:MAG: VIT family protein [Brachybacterium sp.]|uniref:VIT1/CCC1 transporter family protein n=1 Tax=Brachybacterium sp. TaxID=1891286 RepID=UPI002647382F|nr:VIT family protein [Brachybacterium sp.]MDN5688027.1 VIT family protein [Brachybacterium sp.]
MSLHDIPSPAPPATPSIDPPADGSAVPAAPARPPAAEPTSSAAEGGRVRRSERVNRLRAGVLGANDGIVSVAGLAVGVAGATTDTRWLFIAGLASLVAGALSMAMGEYVSVSTQRDTDRSLIARTRADLAVQPEVEHARLVEALADTGIPGEVVGPVADSLERHDALSAHTRFRHGVEDDAVVSPWGAAVTSLVSFTLGGLVPLLAILASPAVLRLPVTMAAVVAALALLGVVSARLGQSAARRSTLRTIIGGVLALLVTYGIGAALGVTVV